MEEMLDLLYADGRPAGKTIRRGEAVPEGLYHGVVDVWLVNSRGEILIQQRDASKPNWPGYWCESAGGAVQSGEEPDAACIRETEEEIGFTPDFERGGKVFEYLGRHALHHVYLFCQDADPASMKLQPGEVSAVQLVSPTDIRRLIRDGKMIPIGYIAQLLQMLPILTNMYGKAD